MVGTIGGVQHLNLHKLKLSAVCAYSGIPTVFSSIIIYTSFAALQKMAPKFCWEGDHVRLLLLPKDSKGQSLCMLPPSHTANH